MTKPFKQFVSCIKIANLRKGKNLKYIHYHSPHRRRDFQVVKHCRDFFELQTVKAYPSQFWRGRQSSAKMLMALEQCDLGCEVCQNRLVHFYIADLVFSSTMDSSFTASEAFWRRVRTMVLGSFVVSVFPLLSIFHVLSQAGRAQNASGARCVKMVSRLPLPSFSFLLKFHVMFLV